MEIVVRWNGPGWYGPLSRYDGHGEYIEYSPVPGMLASDGASPEDVAEAGKLAYGHVGTPDWFDSREEITA